MSATRRPNVKMLAAVIGGSAVVAMGALTMAITQEQTTPATITGSGMTVGATSTQETAPSAPETTLAEPVVKATPFGGAGLLVAATFHLRPLRLPKTRAVMVDPRELFEARDRMEWSEVKSSQLKVVAAGIGAGALVSMGALTVVFSDAPGSISEGPEITMGETSTSTTAPLSVETSIATPEVTASTPEGFGNGA